MVFVVQLSYFQCLSAILRSRKQHTYCNCLLISILYFRYHLFIFYFNSTKPLLNIYLTSTRHLLIIYFS